MLDKKILLTGGTGYLGSHILKRLIQEKYDVVVLKRSSSYITRISEVLNDSHCYNLDQTPLDQVFRAEKFSTILHCATNYGRGNTDPIKVIDANLILPLKLLDLAKKNGIPYFINTDTILDKGISYYSLSKKQFKDWLRQYSPDLACINVALEHFYGPGDDKTKFVSFIIDALIRNQEKIDLTLGEQKRDFIYIDDVVEAFLVILKNINRYQSGFYEFEIGTKNLTSIREIVELIKKMLKNTHTQLNFGAVPYRPKEVMQSNVNLTEISKLNWIYQTKLDEGLKKVIEYEVKQVKGRNMQ